jgi:hypothetical protein
LEEFQSITDEIPRAAVREAGRSRWTFGRRSREEVVVV